MSLERALDALAAWMDRHPKVLVLTGAGCSTASGIPAYRDEEGRWRHRRPMTYATFTGSESARRRYWAGSLEGWRRMSGARPNAAHRALAALEEDARVTWLLTQNVDGLHQRAGSRRVVDLHGRVDSIRCLGCERRTPRVELQARLEERNPSFVGAASGARPDGDSEIEAQRLTGFRVPSCERCGGLLKPDVVFFGEAVPAARVARARARLEASDGLLVVGSSLMVWSGYRFVRWARALGRPVAAVNRGRTRADGELDLKLEADAPELLGRYVASGRLV